jgi:hypothetical protein
MTSLATLQPQPAPAAATARSVVVRRKCACSACALTPPSRDDETRTRLVQTKLTVGPSHDPFERAADRVAEHVLAGPRRGGPAPAIEPVSGTAAAIGAPAPASVAAELGRAGAPLEPEVRTDMERRFGYDFSRVRVHCDAGAGRSAGDVGAEAYTAGHHIVFGAGRYAPHSGPGRSLLAHELAHVVQQAGGAGGTVQRAVTRIGPLTVTIDYDDVALVPLAGQPDRIIAQVTTLSAAPDAATETAIRALAPAAKEWLVYALEILIHNTAAAGSLSMPRAVQRLLAHAPVAKYPPSDPRLRFVREALRVSGWSQEALAARLPAPGAADRAAVRAVVNPPPTSGSASDPLDVAELDRRLPPALEHLLKAIDPARWTNVGTRSISAFQALGDVIQAQARRFFAPYADAATGNIFTLSTPWHASANIFDVGTVAPDTRLRLGYLRNRAEIVGRSTATTSGIIDANIFADVHFDSTRADDRRALTAILTTMEADPAIQPIVDRLIQHTGRQTGTGAAATIGLVTEFNADAATACQDHWRGIDTLCHEVLHALVHPDFTATARRVSFPQVIREGFTEVLGVQLFNRRVVPKAAGDPAFKATLEGGVSGAPCPAPAAATIGYGAAGAGAETIRKRVGDDNFRAAYFLGRPALAGLPT